MTLTAHRPACLLRPLLSAALGVVLLMAAACPAGTEAAGQRSRRRKTPTFKNVKGILGLNWQMDVSKVKAVFKRKSIKFKEEWMRGHFPTPALPGQKSRGPSTCVTFHRLNFRWKKWTASAEFTGWQLHSVGLLQAGVKNEAAVLAIRNTLERKYGRAKLRRAPSKKQGGQIAQWSNPETILTLTAYFWKGGWNVRATYRSAKRSGRP